MNPFMNALAKIGRNPFSNVQQVMNEAQQIQRAFRNPQALVQQFFSDVPQEMQNDPEQIIQYLIQSGRITQQQVDQLKQMFPRK